MGKIKAASQNKSAIKNTQIVLKKRRKRKANNNISSKIPKNNSKKAPVSNEIEYISRNIQDGKKREKYDSSNMFLLNDIKRLDAPIKHSKDKITKIRVNTESADSKTKHRKRNRKRKRDTNANQAESEIKEANLAVKIKKVQTHARKINNLKKNKIETQNAEIVTKKKGEQASTKLQTQQVKSEKIFNINNRKMKIKRLEEMLTNKTQTGQVVSRIKEQQPITLRDRMMAQLRASRFRFINETLYNNESSQSKQYFKEDLDAFKAYHDGYKQQLEQWPINPLDIIISSIKKMPTDNIIADFGCGEARLATSVSHKVHSFDFVSINDKVKACDMAHTPLLTSSVHVVVFCLSLMGTNLNDYIMEANRVLKNNGILKIAEVESRFEDVQKFIRLLGSYGFKSIWKDLSHNLFYFMDFKKEEDISAKRRTLPPITLKSCLYKKR